MSKKFNNIMLVAWAILLVFNLMGMLYDPSKFHFLLTGFVAGFFLHMLLVNPLLNIMNKHINFLNKITNRLVEDIKELQKKKLKGKKKK